MTDVGPLVDEEDASKESNIAAMQLRMLQRERMEAAAVEVAIQVVDDLVTRRPVVVLCRTTRGNAHHIVARSSFWEITNRLSELVKRGTPNKLLVIILTLEVPANWDDVPDSIKYASENGWYIRMAQLKRSVAYEYMRLRLGTDKVDEGVMFFVYLITFGRPKFILETIDLLLREDHVSMDETT